MRGVLAVGVVLIAFAFASGLVAAQAPQNPCDASNFAVTHVAPATIEPASGASVTFTVTNKGSVDATVNVSASVAKTPGWRISGATQQSQAIPPNGKADFAFSIAADAGATPSSGAEIDFQGQAACMAPGGLPLPACPPQAAQACIVQLKADSATLALAPKSGLHIPGLDNLNFPIEYLIAGVVLVAVLIAIPLALRRRRGSAGNAVLSCPEPLKTVRAGKGASFPIELKNAGDKATKVALEVGAVPEGWSAFLPLPEIQLAAKEARGIWLMVRAPADAKSGDAAEVEVRATDPETSRATTVKVRAEVIPA